MSKPQSPLKRVGSYLKGQHRSLFFIAVFTIAASALTLAGPYLLGRAIDGFIIPKERAGLARACLLLASVYAASAFVAWIQARLLASVSQRTVWRMRGDLFGHIQNLPLRYFIGKKQGDLMSRATNDIENVSNTLNQSLVQLLSSVLSIVGSFAVMIWLQPLLTVVAISTVPLIFLASRRIGAATKKQFRLQQLELGAINGYTEETVSGRRIVTLFNQEERAAQEFGEMNGRLRTGGVKAQIISGLMGPSMNVLGHLNYLLIAAAGGWLAAGGHASAGVIVSFLAYSKQFSSPINELANQYNLIQAGIAGAERVFETMDVPSEHDGPEPSEPLPGSGLSLRNSAVAFDRVGFAYSPEASILEEISFRSEPGSMTALVGPTGAGKTTIMSLLARFYEPTSGVISIGGEEIGKLDKRTLRSRIGIVLQDSVLFKGTIRDNIRYGRLDASDVEIERAAKAASAHDFIIRMPDGYDTELSADGGSLSQGQRQLLSIARTLLADPDILILDEATSSVDTLAELRIQQAMGVLMEGRTSFVIAHRLSTIRAADTILVVDGGRIVQQGNHDQLYSVQGLYQDLHARHFQSVS